MREWQRPLEFDRPTWDMIKYENIYTNSRKDFRWRHCPKKDEDKITASTYTTLSYECADDVEEADFPFSEEGLKAANEWIESQFRKFVENNLNRY